MISSRVAGSRSGALAPLTAGFISVVLVAIAVGTAPLRAQTQSTPESKQDQPKDSSDQTPIPSFVDELVVTASRAKETTREVTNNVTIVRRGRLPVRKHSVNQFSFTLVDEERRRLCHGQGADSRRSGDRVGGPVTTIKT